MDKRTGEQEMSVVINQIAWLGVFLGIKFHTFDDNPISSIISYHNRHFRSTQYV